MITTKPMDLTLADPATYFNGDGLAGQSLDHIFRKDQEPIDLSTRRDASPIAKPASDGFLAHTPDETQYFRSAHGVMIPRADHDGVSRGFKPGAVGVVTIDPADPWTGAGGLQVDLGRLGRESALAQGRDTQRTSGGFERTAPPKSGYVVPASNTSGAIVEPQASNEQVNMSFQMPSDFTPVSNPAVSGVQPTVQAPVAASVPFQAAAPEVARPGTPTGAGTDSAMSAMLSMFSTMLTRLNELETKQAAAQTGSAAPIVKESPVVTQAPPQYKPSVLDQFVAPPGPPREPVIFDLGAGGVHRTQFHHVSVRRNSIFLYYDDRYKEGYRFLPPSNQDAVYKITLPKHGDAQYNVTVLPLNNELGHVEIVQLLVVSNESANTAVDEPSVVDQVMTGEF